MEESVLFLYYVECGVGQRSKCRVEESLEKSVEASREDSEEKNDCRGDFEG